VDRLENKEIRLGMVGSGDISNRFFEQASRLPNVSFVATCAKHIENAEKKAKKYNVQRWYEDYVGMMENEQLDAIVVTTPHIVGEGKKVKSDVDDNATVIVEFENGQHAVIRTLWGTSFVQNNTIIYGRKGTVALNDSGFPLVIHSLEASIPDAEQVTWRGIKECYVPKELPSFGPEQDIMGHFVHCLRTGDQPKPSGRLQLHVHEIMFGAYESAQTGQRYDLKTTFKPWNRLDPQIFDTKSDFI
jgi:predicted dehydrogenase